MTQSVASIAHRNWLRLGAVILCAAIGTIVGVSRHPVYVSLAILGMLGYTAFAAVSVRQPMLFVMVFLFVLEIFPPFYFSQSGETPIYVSFFLLPIIAVIFIARFADMRFSWDPVGMGLLLFLWGTALSLPFAWWLSGPGVGKDGLSRWLLLSHGVLIYYLIRGCNRWSSTAWGERILKTLLIGAVISAAYGILDFVWPIPLPHTPADQFIWLENAILRRAQGVFYESSNFANFCGFFLIVSSSAFLARKERYVGVPRTLLMSIIAVLSVAVFVAFSRSAWVGVLTALLASILVSRDVKIHRTGAVFAAFAVPLILVWLSGSELWTYFVDARIGRVFGIFSDPNSATSGRYDTWIRVLSIMREQPQYLIFGIGYKTLPVTRLFHGEIITDNGYLSLLLETGVIGLTGFLILSRSVLKTFFTLARTASALTAFWSGILFSLWCGELVLLLAADAYTYWRNIVIISAMMAITLNLAERSEFSRSVKNAGI
jgi:hypothetical protein